MSDIQYYVYGRAPDTERMEHVNRKSWRIIDVILDVRGYASLQHLTDACKGHRGMTTGARGFVLYCVRNGWIVPMLSSDRA